MHEGDHTGVNIILTPVQEAVVLMEQTNKLDAETTIAELRQAVQQFVVARQWERYHTSKNLAMSIAIEAAEIMEHFQWLSIEESAELVQDAAARAEVADELADVLIYCLSFANQANIDISTAIRTKLKRNEVRFPVDQMPNHQR